MPRNKTKFNQNWLKIYPWISEVDDDIYKAYCKFCKCTIKIDIGGVYAVNIHQKTAKHNRVDPNQDSTDVLSNGDVLKEDLDYSTESNQEEVSDFEAYWFDPDTAAETSTNAATTSPAHLEREEKPIPKKISTQIVRRNDRTLSVQRMKMFEAELSVWQRKGEAIVKLMETVGHDKEMWEIINKQSRLHERERDRIREEYDIL